MMRHDSENSRTARRVAEIIRLLEINEADTAVKASGEYLAEADAVWREAFNAHTDDFAAFDDVIRLGVAHADALFIAGEYRDALSVSLMLMYQTAVARHVDSHASSMLALTVVAMSSLQQCLPMLPPDDFTRQHLTPLLGYLASLSIAYYKDTRDEGDISDDTAAWRERAYFHLHDLVKIGLVQYPQIVVTTPDGTVTTTASQPADVLTDALAHAKALGLLEL